MLAHQMDAATFAESSAVVEAEVGEAVKATTAKTVVKDKRTGEVVRATPTLRPGYQYRAANWEIGRAAERAGIRVTPFKPGNRFLAWRKANVRKAKNAERRGLTRRR